MIHLGLFPLTDRQRLNGVARRHGLAMQFTGLGSMLAVHMTDGPIRSAEDAERGNGALRDLFYFDLVAGGIWFAKRGMSALSIALDDADGDKLVDAVEEFAQTRAPLFQSIGAGEPRAPHGNGRAATPAGPKSGVTARILRGICQSRYSRCP